MAILRVHTIPTASRKPQKTPNTATQDRDAERQAHYVDIFRSHLTTADAVDELVRAIISDRTAKHLVIFYLDEEHRVLSYTIMTVGPLRIASISQRELFQRAIETGAAAIMLAHHHPQGTATPSQEDRKLVRQWRKSGSILEIPILDLVTVTEEDFLSLKHEIDVSFSEPSW